MFWHKFSDICGKKGETMKNRWWFLEHHWTLCIKHSWFITLLMERTFALWAYLPKLRSRVPWGAFRSRFFHDSVSRSSDFEGPARNSDGGLSIQPKYLKKALLVDSQWLMFYKHFVEAEICLLKKCESMWTKCDTLKSDKSVYITTNPISQTLLTTCESHSSFRIIFRSRANLTP